MEVGHSYFQIYGSILLSLFHLNAQLQFLAVQNSNASAHRDGVHEIPLLLHKPSNSFFGCCQFHIINEVPFTGDDIILAHGLEVTMQRLCPLLISDHVFSHTVLGLSNEY